MMWGNSYAMLCIVECNARDMKAVRHIVDGAKAMCTSLRSWLHRKDTVVRVPQSAVEYVDHWA